MRCIDNSDANILLKVWDMKLFDSLGQRHIELLALISTDFSVH